MQLLLRKDVENLGSMGDIVTVKDGYARNYLLPKRLATTVSETHLREVEAARKKLADERDRALEGVRSLGEQLESASCTVVAKANEEGHLFGSVGPQQIADALAADGFKVDEKMIDLDTHIKELGVYNVTIKLHSEITATCKVWVVGE